MDLNPMAGTVMYYDPLIKKCVKCPSNMPRCRKVIKREYWIDCTSNLKPYESYYAGIREKMSKSNISSFS